MRCCAPMARRSSGCWAQLVADEWVAAAPLHWPKGSTWLLQRANQRRVGVRYLAPLAFGGRVEIG